MRQRIGRIDRIGRVGARVDDPPDVKLGKSSLVTMAVLIGLVTPIWVLSYLAFGLTILAAIPRSSPMVDWPSGELRPPRRGATSPAVPEPSALVDEQVAALTDGRMRHGREMRAEAEVCLFSVEQRTATGQRLADQAVLRALT